MLIFAIILLVLVTALKFGFDFLNSQEEKVIAKYDKEITSAKENFPVDNQKAVLTLAKSVKNLKTLLENKVKTSSFLTSIADNTHKDIYFTQLNSNIENQLVEITGVATNLSVISQASIAFAQIDGIENAEVKNVRNMGNTITFNINLLVNSSFFK